MKKIRFKLADNVGFLEAQYNEGIRHLEFILEQEEGEQVQEFKLHKIQVMALIKALNEPMNLGLVFKK